MVSDEGGNVFRIMRLLTSSLCAVLVAGALAFSLWNAQGRLRRIDYVTGLAAGAVQSGAATSVGRHELIVPERHESSYHWLAQTDQMFRRKELRIRHVDYDNAPAGRETRLTSPYRWWLGGIAVLSRGTATRTAVENAARWSDPLIQVILLVGGALFVVRRFGAMTAATFAASVAAVFPFGSEFLPGAPDARALALALALASVLSLVSGICSGSTSEHGARSAFLLGGVLGGLAMWVDLATGFTATAAVAAGALLLAVVERGQSSREARPWRVWSLAGGGTVLAAYLFEFAPGFASANLDAIHPWYGLGCIAVGELLTGGAVSSDGNQSRSRYYLWVRRTMGAAVVIAFTVVLVKSGGGAPFVRDDESIRLARTPGADAATGLIAWLTHPRSGIALAATLAPFALGVVTLVFALRRAEYLRRRSTALVLLGALCVSTAIACVRLRDWALVDVFVIAILTTLAAEIAAGSRRVVRWTAISAIAAALIIGARTLSRGVTLSLDTPLNATEAEEVIERDLAQWLAQHEPSDHAVVFAPPHQTLTLAYYGGLRGLGTYAPENRAGFGVSIRLAGAGSLEAVQAIVDAHQVRYIVIPSWDPFFEDFARLYLAPNLANRGSLLVQELRRLNLPNWIRPVPYQMPPIGGFEKQWVLVFEVVDEQSPVVATSRLADYLVEMGDMNRASAVAQALRRYPGNVGALAALAQLQLAVNDANGAHESVNSIAALVASGSDRNLPVDRRIAVAIALARGQQEQPARSEVERCLRDIDEAQLRSLNTGTLYNFVVLVRALDLKWPQPRLAEIALDLLPPDVRKQL
jgi:hypothetical protein